MLLKFLISFVVFNSVICEDVIIGLDFERRSSFTQVNKLGFPLIRRSEEISFEYPEGTRITGIVCLDLTKDKSGTVTLLYGGLGYNIIGLEFLGGRSDSLKYSIEIYTEYKKRIYLI